MKAPVKSSFTFILFFVPVFMILFSTSNVFAQEQDTWSTDFAKAQTQAQEQNKNILLNFSGSDWCGPCIKLHKEILTAPTFLQYASTNLVLINADFPRLKKNMQDKALKEQNEKLADQYNKEGKFPLTILLDKNLKVLKVWDGYPHFTQDEELVSPANEFINQLKEIISGYTYH